MRWAILIASLLLVVRAFAGDGVPGAGSVVPAGVKGAPVSHAWFAVPDADSAHAMLLHLPPGDPTSTRVRLVREVAQIPVFVAARDARVYMVFEEQAPDTRAFPTAVLPARRVLSLEAQEASPGQWVTVPAERLNACPAIDGEGSLLGVAGSDVGLYALRRVSRDGAPAIVLERMGVSDWTPINVPEEAKVLAGAPGDERSWGIFGVPGGVGLFSWKDADAVCWLGDESQAGGLAWSRVQIDLPDRPLSVTMAWVGGEIVLGASQTGSTMSIRARTPGGTWRTVARVPGIGPDCTVIPDDSGGSLRFVWLAQGQQDVLGRVRIRSLSIGTGRLGDASPLRLASPISRADFVMLVFLLAMVVGMIMAVLFRPNEAAVNLPDGYAIADPPLRMVAGVIDAGIGLLAISAVFRVPWSDLATTEWWASTRGSIVLIATLGFLVVMGTLLETAFGKTVGKFLTACEVADVGPRRRAESPSPPSLQRAFLRNLVKWGLPLVGVLGVLDVSGRFRADQFARTAVVSRLSADEPEDDA